MSGPLKAHPLQEDVTGRAAVKTLKRIETEWFQL